MKSEVVMHIGYSHSLAMDLLWAALFASPYFLLRRDRRGAWVLGAAVLSHWFLDLASHRPDMPLVPGSSARLRVRPLDFHPRHSGCGGRPVDSGCNYIFASHQCKAVCSALGLLDRFRDNHGRLVQQYCRTAALRH